MQRYLMIYVKEEEGDEEISIESNSDLKRLLELNPDSYEITDGEVFLNDGFLFAKVWCNGGEVELEEIYQSELESVLGTVDVDEDEEEEEEGWVSVTINGLPVKVPQGTTWTDIVEKVGGALHNQALGCTPPSNLSL